MAWIKRIWAWLIRPGLAEEGAYMVSIEVPLWPGCQR